MNRPRKYKSSSLYEFCNIEDEIKSPDIFKEIGVLKQEIGQYREKLVKYIVNLNLDDSKKISNTCKKSVKYIKGSVDIIKKINDSIKLISKVGLHNEVFKEIAKKLKLNTDPNIYLYGIKCGKFGKHLQMLFKKVKNVLLCYNSNSFYNNPENFKYVIFYDNMIHIINVKRTKYGIIPYYAWSSNNLEIINKLLK
jgi:hypothetical protein